MPKYRLCASVNWIYNSDTDFGIEDCEDEEQALEWAFDSACERLSVWVEEINEEAKD